MRTRIISAAVAVALFAGVYATKPYTPWPMTAVCCLLAALAVYEMLHNTGINRQPVMLAIAVCYGAAVPLLFSRGVTGGVIFAASAVFVCVCFSFAVFMHKKVSVQQAIMTFALPMAIAFSFATILEIFLVPGKDGLLAVLLLCGFAWITDTGAYFAGVLFGKHKIAPDISPKKTAEGCAGGILLCVVYTFFVSWGMLGDIRQAAVITALSPVFAVLGMLGDLSASLIKRAYGVKDYGVIMPGHGGVMDRFDSILFIAPCFFCLLGLLGFAV